MRKPRYRAADIFAGAGGPSLGFEKEGFSVPIPIETHQWAILGTTSQKMLHEKLEVAEKLRETEHIKYLRKRAKRSLIREYGR